MSAGVTLELKGFKEVINVFNKLPTKMQRKALTPALRAGAKIIQTEVKRTMRKDTSKNIKYLKIKSIKRTRTGIGVMIVTGTRDQLGIAGDDPYYYPAIQEYGKKGFSGDRAQRNALRKKKDEATRVIGTRLKLEQEKLISAMKKVR